MIPVNDPVLQNQLENTLRERLDDAMAYARELNAIYVQVALRQALAELDVFEIQNNTEKES